jgi:hypothetical protein
MQVTVENQSHHVVLKDGATVYITKQQAHRALYAIITLMQTPLAQHMPFQAVFDADGVCLWPPRKREPQTDLPNGLVA